MSCTLPLGGIVAGVTLVMLEYLDHHLRRNGEALENLLSGGHDTQDLHEPALLDHAKLTVRGGCFR